MNLTVLLLLFAIIFFVIGFTVAFLVGKLREPEKDKPTPLADGRSARGEIRSPERPARSAGKMELARLWQDSLRGELLVVGGSVPKGFYRNPLTFRRRFTTVKKWLRL